MICNSYICATKIYKMKKFYFLLIAFGVFNCIYGQNINFLDSNFRNYLVSAGPMTNQYAKNLSGNWFKIDSNNDGFIQITEAQQVSYLKISHSSIRFLNGIEFFTNISELNCSGNSVNDMDFQSLTNLRILSLSGLIYSLNVQGLTNLTNVTIAGTYIQSLDFHGISSILRLTLNNNILNYLNVNGLINLNFINANNNNLSSIDLTGLTSLNSLNIRDNNLTTLDLSGLINLSTVNCDGNLLTNINMTGLTNLTNLYCSGNRLTNLDVSGLTSLAEISCSGNLLTSLDVSGIANLFNLDCSYNLLTTLEVNNFPLLKFLYVRQNQLTSISINNLPRLEYFHCENNQLTSINLETVPRLSNIDCNNNMFTSLNCEFLPYLSILKCYSNRLETLFLKNGRNNSFSGSFLDFHDNPNLKYICTDNYDSEINNVQTLVNNNNMTGVVINSYCSFTPLGNYFSIIGKNRWDTNNNGCDENDIIYPNLKFKIEGTYIGAMIANAEGDYFLPLDAGSYKLTPVLENPTYFYAIPNEFIHNFYIGGENVINQDFCIVPNGGHSDVEVIVLSTIRARPGLDAHYKIIYKNKGNLVENGSVNLTFDDAKMDYVSSNPAYNTQATNQFTWNYSNLQPFETRTIDVVFNINTPMETLPVNGGDVLNYTATILSANTDEIPSDNTFTLNQTVVNSFDPNDKTCLEGATIPTSKVGDYVHYMIRFENNGTANAQNIVVKDMIDLAKFDINSLVPMKGSHSFVTNITAGNRVEFIFENINLPFDDANNDGYVAFKIKTKPTLVLGNTFSNTASIYFDYNFPIVTNTATTTIAALSTQDFEFKNYFSLYPNPVSNILNITSKETIEISSINIYNTLGQLVLVIPNAQETKTVDVSSLTSGNYFIKINSDKGTSNTKFIKQ